MKALKSTLCVVFLAACFMQASAQGKDIPLNNPDYNKPRLFADLPERMLLRVRDAEGLLDLPVGTRVNTTIATGFPITGTIVSKSDPAEAGVKSVVIRTVNKGSVFTFTQITAADGTVSFIGRMLNKDGGDALEIVKEGESYVIHKRNAHEMINE